MGNPRFTRNVRRRGANVHDQTLSVSIVEQIEGDWLQLDDKESTREAMRTGDLTMPVFGKYIYILCHKGNFGGGEMKPELCDEIYADTSGNWYEAKKPGSGEDLLLNEAGQALYFPTPEKIKDYVYHFFITPVRLDAGSLDLLKKWIQKESAKRAAVSVSPNLLGRDKPWWIKGGHITPDKSQEIDPEVTTVACTFEKTGSPYVVAVPDPFALARIRSKLFFHGALGLLDKYNGNARIRDETIIAATLRAVGKDKSWDYIRNDLVNGWDVPGWWKKEGRNKAPAFEATPSWAVADELGNSYTVAVRHAVRINSHQWSKLADSYTGSGKTVMDLYLGCQELVRGKLMLHVSQCAQRLCAWLNCPRHRLVDQAARAAGGEDLAMAAAHWSIVTQRLAETPVGQIFLLTHAKDNTSLFHAMWDLLGLSLPASGEAEKAAHTAVAREKQKEALLKKNFWEESGDAQKVFFSILDLVKNFAGALHAIDNDNLDRTLKLLGGKKIFANAGLVFTQIPSEKLTLKLGLFNWEQQIALKTSLKNAYILVGNESRLKKFFLEEKGFYKRFKIEGWFQGFSYTAKVINLFLAASKVMQGKGDLSEQVKLGLDAISTVAEGVDICRNLKRPVSLPGEPAPPVKASALTKVGAVAGAVGGFIDFHIAVNSSLKSYYEKGNLLETAANVGVAVTAAVSAGLGLYALLVPAAASGPIGWLALAIGAVSLFLSWLASRLSRDGWEEFAKYCFLGAGCLQGTRFSGSDRDLFLGIPSEQFGSTGNLPLQVQSLYGLMAGFYFQTYPSQVHPESYHEAVRGEIRFFPGWTGEKSRVTLYWQFEYGTGYYAYLEVEFSLVHYWGKARVLDTNDRKLALEDIYIGRPVSDKAGQPGSFFIYPKLANFPSIVDKVTVAVSVMANDYARVPYNKQYEFERRSDGNTGKTRKSSLGNCAGTTYKPRISQSSTGDRVDGF